MGFVLNGQILEKVSTGGGPRLRLTESQDRIRGATWGGDDRIIFGTATDGLFEVSGSGGAPEVLTTPDFDQGDRSHAFPAIIPGRGAVVFVISRGLRRIDGQLTVLDLATGEVTRLGLSGLAPQYVSTGHLVYATADGWVSAVPFDAESLAVTGIPAPLVEGVMVKNMGLSGFPNDI